MKIKQCQPIDGWQPFCPAIALPSGGRYFMLEKVYYCSCITRREVSAG
jgi:hypothetical protein